MIYLIAVVTLLSSIKYQVKGLKILGQVIERAVSDTYGQDSNNINTDNETNMPSSPNYERAKPDLSPPEPDYINNELILNI